MKKTIAYSCMFAFTLLALCGVSSAKLTNQQINLLLENDDIQIFTPSLVVKKVSLAIEQSTDNRQGKTIVEYNESGLLVNYYQISAIEDPEVQEQITMITTLMRSEEGKWQRKQTLGSYEIDNSIYALKDNQVQIIFLPSTDFNEQRIVEQQNIKLDNNQGEMVHFSYIPQLEKETFSNDYQFNENNLLVSYDFLNIDENEYSYTTTVNIKFEYDQQQRLVKSIENNYYQLMNEPAEKIITQVSYGDFDQYGNWQTKTELSNDDKITYKRVIEYWNE